jgi:hypothetical protein
MTYTKSGHDPTLHHTDAPPSRPPAPHPSLHALAALLVPYQGTLCRAAFKKVAVQVQGHKLYVTITADLLS